MVEPCRAVLLTLLSFTSAGLGDSLPGSCRIACNPLTAGQSTDQLNKDYVLAIPLASSASSAGPPGPQGPPGKAGPPGLRGPAGVGSEGVAFSAIQQEGFKQNEVVKFSEVITNLGGGYDASTGTFTCRKPGVYVFHFHIVKTGQTMRVDLILNDQTVVVSAVAVDVLHTDTASNSVVLHLRARDRLFIRLITGDLSKRDSQSRLSSFSGYLLYDI